MKLENKYVLLYEDIFDCISKIGHHNYGVFVNVFNKSKLDAEVLVLMSEVLNERR